MSHFNVSVAVKRHHDNKRDVLHKFVKSMSSSTGYKGILFGFVFCCAMEMVILNIDAFRTISNI